MSAPTETELKLAVSPGDVRRLRARIAALVPRAAPRRLHLDNVYYDTDDDLLARHRMALRVRRIGRRWVQTLKTGDTHAALATRGEWEMPAPGGRLDLSRFEATPLAELLAQHAEAQVAPHFRTRFTRAARLYQDGQSVIEVALDLGEITTAIKPLRRAPICEVELELKEGAPQALLAAALHLAAPRRRNATDTATDTAIALLPAGRSKAARGHALVRGERPAPLKADAAALMRAVTSAMSATAVLQKVASNAAAVLIANADGVLETDDPEFVHQARVALRRLRAAVSLLRAHVAFPAALADELRWIARELGAARDADVFAEATLPMILRAVPDEEAAASMAAAAQRRRRQARKAARAALAGPRFALLVLRLMAWSLDTMAGGAAVGNDAAAALRAMGANTAAGAREEIALPAVAAAVLEAAHGKLVRRARRFRKRSPAKRHRVRIAAKRLRYALDTFAVVLPPAATARFVRRLASLQDALGAMNDAVVARHMLATLARHGRLSAWLQRADARLREMEASHVDDAAKQLARLRRVPLPLPQE